MNDSYVVATPAQLQSMRAEIDERGQPLQPPAFGQGHALHGKQKPPRVVMPMLRLSGCCASRCRSYGK